MYKHMPVGTNMFCFSVFFSHGGGGQTMTLQIARIHTPIENNPNPTPDSCFPPQNYFKLKVEASSESISNQGSFRGHPRVLRYGLLVAGIYHY